MLKVPLSMLTTFSRNATSSARRASTDRTSSSSSGSSISSSASGRSPERPPRRNEPVDGERGAEEEHRPEDELVRRKAKDYGDEGHPEDGDGVQQRRELAR